MGSLLVAVQAGGGLVAAVQVMVVGGLVQAVVGLVAAVRSRRRAVTISISPRAASDSWATLGTTSLVQNTREAGLQNQSSCVGRPKWWRLRVCLLPRLLLPSLLLSRLLLPWLLASAAATRRKRTSSTWRPWNALSLRNVRAKIKFHFVIVLHIQCSGNFRFNALIA